MKKHSKYLKNFNKIQNISVIGSTRLQTPFNRKELLYNQIKLHKMSPNKNRVNLKQNEFKLNNSQCNSNPFKEVFRHNKPLSVNNLNILSKMKKKMSSEKSNFPKLSSVNMIEGFNYGRKEYSFNKFDINLSIDILI